MLDKKFLMTLIGLTIAIVAVASIKTSQASGTLEGFGMLPSMQAVPACNMTSAICSPATAEPFSLYGAEMAKSSAPPQNGWGGDRAGSRTNENLRELRFDRPSAGTGMGLIGTVATNVYNRPLPDSKWLAAPRGNLPESRFLSTPYPKQTGENFKVLDDPSKYGAEFYGELLADGHQPSSVNPSKGIASMESFDDAKVGDMINGSTDQQRVVGDRLIFANRNSRLRSQGDPIRGDIPIVPNNTGWFQVSVRPEVDLQGGALNVIAGVSNAQGQAVSDMMVYGSGGVRSAVGGTVVNPRNVEATSFPL